MSPAHSRASSSGTAVHCSACGAEVEPDAKKCACGAAIKPIDGEQGIVFLPLGRSWPVIGECCCCLNRTRVTQTRTIHEGTRKYTYEVRWCKRCYWRSRFFFGGVVLSLAVGFAIGYFVTSAVRGDVRDGWTVAAGIAGAFAACVGWFGVAQSLPAFRRPGHAIGCNAVASEGVQKKDGAAFIRVAFRNPAFARKWSALIDGTSTDGVKHRPHV